ncbi:MAG: hypothetical protein VX917_06650 [Chloroflexota bacterium]|jgi:streptogramin lyase|nr:hypothetical protein [Chloroflexota bacterium]MEC9439097.1 hypothetical protein [Chloroflexota bacterium]|tara:strand:+ start:9142 stop:9813 length:672 start_codon:yes stop_codon:yes gene_type:complete
MPYKMKAEDRWIHPGPQPNGLQADSDGLWAIDQGNDHLYKLSYEDGSIIEDLETETMKSSGVTKGGGFLWVASTYNCLIYKLNEDGTTAETYDTPGKGVVDFAQAENPPTTGAHGMEWIDEENMWVAVPPAKTVFLMDPKTMSVKRSIPTPGIRPHGLFMDEEDIWLADTQECKIHKLDTDTGEILDVIDIEEPEIHGMTLHDRQIWFCCAETRKVCTVTLPG